MKPAVIALIVILVIVVIAVASWWIYKGTSMSWCNKNKKSKGEKVVTSAKDATNDAKTKVQDQQGVAIQVGLSPHKAKALVLSCIDYRFISQTMDYLYGRNNRNDFDYFVLAGASLGYNQSAKGRDKDIQKEPKCWAEAYEEHIDIAVKLHHIEEIIVVDHMDCGMYKEIYGEAVDTPAKETKKHEKNIVKFIDTLKAKPEYSKFRYTGVLLEANENAENISFRVIFSDD